MNPDTLKTLRASLDLSLAGFSVYSGVPVHTLRKWETGERKPDSASIRYLELLSMIRDRAPSLHNHLLDRVNGQPATLAPAKPEKPASALIYPDVGPLDNPVDPETPDVPDWLVAQA